VFALRHLLYYILRRLYLGGMHADAEAPLEILRCRHVCTERCSQVIAADCLWCVCGAMLTGDYR
jgi:hypothetical protein